MVQTGMTPTNDAPDRAHDVHTYRATIKTATPVAQGFESALESFIGGEETDVRVEVEEVDGGNA